MAPSSMEPTPPAGDATAPVAIIMGSRSDWPTMKAATDSLDRLGVAWSARVVSAHRTPDRMVAVAREALTESVPETVED